MGKEEIKRINWNEEFFLNNDLLDEQHKKFIDLLNRFADVISSECKKEIHNLFFEFIYFVDNYLIEKDLSLIKCDKEKYMLHRKYHQKLLDNIKDYYNKYNTTKSFEDCKDLYNFMVDWFKNYIGICFTCG